MMPRGRQADTASAQRDSDDLVAVFRPSSVSRPADFRATGRGCPLCRPLRPRCGAVRSCGHQPSSARHIPEAVASAFLAKDNKLCYRGVNNRYFDGACSMECAPSLAASGLQRGLPQWWSCPHPIFSTHQKNDCRLRRKPLPRAEDVSSRDATGTEEEPSCNRDNPEQIASVHRS